MQHRQERKESSEAPVRISHPQRSEKALHFHFFPNPFLTSCSRDMVKTLVIFQVKARCVCNQARDSQTTGVTKAWSSPLTRTRRGARVQAAHHVRAACGLCLSPRCCQSSPFVSPFLFPPIHGAKE